MWLAFSVPDPTTTPHPACWATTTLPFLPDPHASSLLPFPWTLHAPHGPPREEWQRLKADGAGGRRQTHCRAGGPG